MLRNVYTVQWRNFSPPAAPPYNVWVRLVTIFSWVVNSLLAISIHVTYIHTYVHYYIQPYTRSNGLIMCVYVCTENQLLPAMILISPFHGGNRIEYVRTYVLLHPHTGLCTVLDFALKHSLHAKFEEVYPPVSHCLYYVLLPLCHT